MGYEQPTDVQNEVIPIALEQKDLTVKSRTGSGKTAAFGIPICELVEWEENRPQALILTPTRELCLQTKEQVDLLGDRFHIRSKAIHGGVDIHKQTATLSSSCTGRMLWGKVGMVMFYSRVTMIEGVVR